MTSAITDFDLHALHDGQLPKHRRHTVEAKARADDAASLRLAAWRLQDDALRAQLDPVAAEPAPLRLNIMRIDGGNAARMAQWRRTLFGFIAGFALGIALAGMIFLALNGR
ncbi:MAG: anti-sigma factor family protein [Beijerinckiaceae bacterium]